MIDFSQFVTFIAGLYEQATTPETEVIVKDETGKYATDIKALSSYYPMKQGDEIIITLQELLEICPRKRRRSDAYKGLIAELCEHGISLTIKTNRKNEKN